MRGLLGREKERGQKPLEIRNIKKKLGKGKFWQELEVQCSTRPAPPTVGGGTLRAFRRPPLHAQRLGKLDDQEKN